MQIRMMIIVAVLLLGLPTAAHSQRPANSYFPDRVGKLPTSYDTSCAMAIGGGGDLAVSKHIWIRAVQADYYYSELRNLQGNRRNQFRIGSGIAFRAARKVAISFSLFFIAGLPFVALRVGTPGGIDAEVTCLLIVVKTVTRKIVQTKGLREK